MSLIHRHGVIAGNAPKVRVLHVENGGYVSSVNWPIQRVIMYGKFYSNPSYYYYSKYSGTAPTGDICCAIRHENDFCQNWDSKSNQNSDAEGLTVVPYNFTAYNDVWRNWDIVSDEHSGYFKIFKDGLMVRNYDGMANSMDQVTDVTYTQYILRVCSMDIRRLRVYDLDDDLRYDWNFEAGANEPAGWSGATIKNVKL